MNHAELVRELCARAAEADRMRREATSDLSITIFGVRAGAYWDAAGFLASESVQGQEAYRLATQGYPLAPPALQGLRTGSSERPSIGIEPFAGKVYVVGPEISDMPVSIPSPIAVALTVLDPEAVLKLSEAIFLALRKLDAHREDRENRGI